MPETNPSPPAPPKTGLLTSIDELSDGIFNKPPAERILKEKEAIERVASGKPAPKPEPPTVAPAPGVNPAEKHEDDLVIDGIKVEQPAEIKSEQGVKSWRAAKEAFIRKTAEYEKRIKDMESRVSTTPDPAALATYEAKIIEIQKERDDLNERLGRASIERTPEFERHYVKRITNVIEDAKGAVGKDLADRVAHILEMPDSPIRNGQINDVMADMDELQKHELSLAVKDLRQINKEKKEQIDNWKDGLSKREKILAEKQEQSMKQYSQVFDSVLSDIHKEHPLLAPKEGDAEWTGRSKNLADAARELYLGKGTPQERARASVYGVVSAVLLETLKAQNEEMSKLTKQVEALRGKQPAVDAKGDIPATALPPGVKAESMLDRIARTAKESGFVK